MKVIRISALLTVFFTTVAMFYPTWGMKKDESGTSLSTVEMVWIKAGGKAYKVAKQQAERLGMLKTALAFRARQGKKNDKKHPIDLDKLLNDKAAAKHLVQYLQKNDRQREFFLQSLDQQSLNNFITILSFGPLQADPALIMFQQVHEYLRYNGATRTILDGDQKNINTITFSPNSRYIVARSNDQIHTPTLWNVNTHISNKLPWHPSFVVRMAFGTDDRYVFGSFDTDNNFSYWGQTNVSSSTVGNQYWSWDSRVVFSPDNKYLVAAQDNKIAIMNAQTGNKITELVGHTKEIITLMFSANGKRLASGSKGKNNNLCVWNPTNGHHTMLDGHTKRVNAVVFDSKSNNLFSASDGSKNNLIWWDLKQNEKTIFPGHQNNVNDLAIDLKNKYLVSVSDGKNNNVIVHNLADHTDTILVGHLKSVKSVAISPDGEHFVTVSNGKKNNVIVWNVRGKKVATLDGHPKSVVDVAISPNGKYIATACRGKKKNLALWQLRSMPKDPSITQAGLLYRAYWASKNNKQMIMNERDWKIVSSFSDKFQKNIAQLGVLPPRK